MNRIKWLENELDELYETFNSFTIANECAIRKMNSENEANEIINSRDDSLREEIKELQEEYKKITGYYYDY